MRPQASPSALRAPLEPGRAVSPQGPSIWLYAAGYFLAYAPYTALTKALTSGLFGETRLSGLQILPLSTIASMLGMVAFVTWKGWWRFAHHTTLFGRRVPTPMRATFLSGIATAAIIATTTLSYAIDGTSILVMMLFMRGGVLVIAPLVDLLSRRHVRTTAWIALALSAAALVVALGDGETHIEALGLTVIVVYLAAYFFRLRFMTGHAKAHDHDLARRFFVEEQMVATPAIVGFLILLAAVGANDTMREIRAGFFDVGGSLGAVLVIAIGLFSQGTGVFGALVLLDGRENAFCVPVNRASSVLAGFVASAALFAFLGGKAVPLSEMLASGMLVFAIALLAVSGRTRSG